MVSKPQKIDVITRYEGLLRENLGLDPVQFRRLGALVGLHAYADRLLASLLAVGTATDEIASDDTKAERLFDAIADITFARRLELALALGLLPPDNGADLATLNAVRNSLLHVKRGKRKVMFGLGTIPEIAHENRFKDVLRRGTTSVLFILNRFLPPEDTP